MYLIRLTDRKNCRYYGGGVKFCKLYQAIHYNVLDLAVSRLAALLLLGFKVEIVRFEGGKTYAL